MGARKVGAERVGARRVECPKFELFFFPSPAPFSLLFSLSQGVFSCLFFLSLAGLFVEFWWFEAPGPSNVHVWALGLSSEERKRHEKIPRERKKSENGSGEEGKHAKFGESDGGRALRRWAEGGALRREVLRRGLLWRRSGVRLVLLVLHILGFKKGML